MPVWVLAGLLDAQGHVDYSDIGCEGLLSGVVRVVGCADIRQLSTACWTATGWALAKQNQEVDELTAAVEKASAAAAAAGSTAAASRCGPDQPCLACLLVALAGNAPA